ncbi:hypothetical protein [Puerhibacterium puerhi]|uniref:hypothetical protein n=1 Tax=Puerhibacterium puerhi TaxID=2692623 RepID=UPI0013579140|nr:hypothetical protein [Puerhibacterium puerhi]
MQDAGPHATPDSPATPPRRRRRRGRELPDLPPEALAEAVADRVRERVYVTFATLAVLLTLGAHSHGLRAAPAAASLVITAVGTVVAAYVAELIAHVAVHAELPGRLLLRRMAWVSLGAVTTAVVPLLLLGAAALGWWEVGTALVAGSVTLVATLVLIGWFGLRRARLPWWQKLLALVVLAALGTLVLVLKMLAH